MPVHIQEEGNYELFETTKGHRILVLRDEQWFAWVEGQRGEILVKSGPDHQKSHTLQRGTFYVADFEDDPNYRDVPHLFLEHQERYQELVLPNGLPTDQDDRKKIIPTDNTLAKDRLERDLQRSGSTGEDKATPDLPIDNYEALTVEEIVDRLEELSASDIERLQHHEKTHKDRKTLRSTFDRRLRKRRAK